MSQRVDIREFARLLKHTESPFTGQQFVPQPWQDEYLDKLYNTRRADGRRQYQRSLLALPRKSGKTAMCAVIGAYEGFFGEAGGQILIAAGDRKQASLLFTACSRYIESCPGLLKRCKIYKNSIVMPHLKSTIQFLSSEHKGKHGFNPSLVIVDEYHVQPNRDLVDVLESGMGARAEPLVIYVTTAGMDRVGPCYDEWQRAIKVRDGLIDDPTFLPCVFAAPDDADIFDESTWKVASPNYGVTVRKEFMEREAVLAKESVAQELKFRTLYLNQWCSNGANKFFRTGQFESCSQPLRPPAGRPCYCGLDLSSTQDTTAFAAVWPGLDDSGMPFHSRSSSNTAMPQKSTTPQSYSSAIACTAVFITRIRSRMEPITRDLRAGSPKAKITTVAPVARSDRTPRSRDVARRSTSNPGRRASLTPAAKVTRSGFNAMAAGTCSSTTCGSSRPRTARLA